MAPRRKAPDGGWGWVVVAAHAVNNVIIVPVMQSFTLIFRETFKTLGMNSTDTTFVVNLNASFGMILGLFTGSMIKRYGFRKVAMISSLTSALGVFLTSFSNSFADFIIYYGLISSMGSITILVCFGVAQNTYFDKRRSQASGLCMTLTGLGPIVMPLVISFLMDELGARGACLTLSALILHSFAGSLTLQPVKWHYKEIPESAECNNIKSDEEGEAEEVLKTEDEEEEDIKDDICDTYSVQDFEHVSYPRRVSDVGLGRRMGQLTRSVSLEPDGKWWRSSSSLKVTPRKSAESINNFSRSKMRLEGIKESSPRKDNFSLTQDSKRQSLWQRFVAFYDFDLLADTHYLILILGLCFGFSADVNFSLTTPLILGDRGFNIDHTAKIMSFTAMADIVARMCAPYVGNRLKLSSRWMLFYSFIFITLGRFFLTFAYSFVAVSAVFTFIGLAKGFRSVYYPLVVPNYVPIEKLPSATGQQTLLNGLLMLSGGPLLGVLRDTLGNYNYCLHAINACLMTTCLIWVIEYFIRKRRRNSTKDEVEKNRV